MARKRRVIPEYKGDLAGFTGMLRKQVFSAQQQAADYVFLNRTTVVRYENENLRPPLGYLACLAKRYVELLDQTNPDALSHTRQALHQQLNRAIDYEYDEEVSFKDWADLEAVATEYLATQRARKPAEVSQDAGIFEEMDRLDRPQPERFWRRIRLSRQGLLLIAILLLLLVGGVGYYYTQRTTPPPSINILVADFQGPSPKTYRVTEIVLAKLRQALARTEAVEISALNDTITEAEGSQVARTIGDRHQATIVIWGWYSVTAKKVAIRVNFEMIRPLQYVPEYVPASTGDIWIRPIDELESFRLQGDLSTGLTQITFFTIGLVHYTREDWAQAIIFFSQAIDSNERELTLLDQSIIYLFRGLSYFHQNAYEKSRQDYDRAIDLNPKFAEGYHNRANVFRDTGDDHQALKDYSKAIELDPTHAGSYYGRATIYRRLLDFDRTLAEYTLAIEHDPDNYWAYFGRGETYSQQNDYNLSIQDYTDAIELAPTYIWSYYGRGIAYSKIGSLDLAIADYDRVIALDPTYSWAYIARAKAFDAKGNLKQAIENYDQAIKLDPTYPWAYTARGALFRKQGNRIKPWPIMNKRSGWTRNLFRLIYHEQAFISIVVTLR